MKRVFILFAALIFLPSAPLLAQDDTTNAPVITPSPATTAAAIAAKEEAEDRYQRMAADLQAVQSDNVDLRAKITAMEQEIATLRDAQAHAADNSGIQDQLKHLADAIQEVDKKRMEDKDAIADEIRKSIGGLETSLGNTSTPTRTSRPKPAPVDDTTPAAPVDGYSYTVQSGDRLDLIVKAYNADFVKRGYKKITLRQTKEANPKVDWNRLRVGQKIVIPKPEGQ